MPRTLLFSFLAGVLLLLAASACVLVPGLAPRTAMAAYTETRPVAAPPRDAVAEANRAPRPEVGAEAPDLDVSDEIGAEFHLRSHRGRPVLLSVFCPCAVCRETAQRWRDLFHEHPRDFVAAALVALPKGDALFDFHDSLRLNYVLIPDPSRVLAAAYPAPGAGPAALTCPRAWVIDRTGRYRYVVPAGAAPSPAVLAKVRRALGIPEPGAE